MKTATITWREIAQEFPRLYNRPFSHFKDLPQLVLEDSGIKLTPLWDTTTERRIVSDSRPGFSFESEKDKLAFILKYS